MGGDGFTFLGYPAGAFAAGSHTHAGADVDSGTVAYARLPVGTAASTVAIGDHSHAPNANTPSVPADRGYHAWTMPIASCSGGTVLSPAGTLHLNRILRVPAGTITSIVIAVTTVGNTLTSGQCFAALFTSAGAPVGTTDSQHTAWVSTGLKVMNLTTPYVNPTLADLYVGLWYNGTTGPAVARGGSVTSALSNAGLTAPNLAHATADTGLTTTAPVNLGTQTASALQHWVALK